MEKHIELGIIVAMSAMMVFGTAALVMPYVYAASSSTGSGGSGTSGASGASGTAGVANGGAGGKGDNQGSVSSSPPPTNPPPKNPTPKTTPTPASKPPASKPPASKVPFCNPHGCKGDPGYYTQVGHHHCYDGYPGCVCTTPSKCGVAYGRKS